MAMRAGRSQLVRLFWKRLALLAVLFLVVVVGVAVWEVYGKEYESRLLRQQAEREANDLREQKDTLTAHLERLKTDRGKEAALRSQYGVAREGEELIVIVETQQPVPIQASSTMQQWVHRFLPFW